MKAQLLKILFITLIPLTLQSCLPIIAGGVVESALILGDRRPVGVVTIDRGLQIQLDTDMSTKFADTAHVNINVYNQKVLLTGEAMSATVKAQIEALVKNQKNVKSVENELQIGPNSSVGSRVTDSSIFTVVRSKLLATSDVPSNSIKVVVEAGNVYLLGITTELEAKAAAVVASKSSNSIKQVVKLFDIISEEEKRRLDKSQSSQGKTN